MKSFWNEKLKAALFYLAAIAIFHAPVVFSGKTFEPALYQPHGVLDGWAEGYDGRTPAPTFNIDLATPAYYEAPINRLVGNLYKNGELPLWNPYQGAGMPLAAQYSTRAFFPYQILEDLSPATLADLFTLGRVFIAGFFTFLFLRALGLSFIPSLSGGLIYMFSGPFTWFVNLEQFTNVAIALPVHLYCIERLAGSGSRRDAALAGASFALVILAGQPEIALYALALGACYYALRVFIADRGRALAKGLAKYAGVAALGLALSSPLILPFLELMKNSHHLHEPGGEISTRDNLRPVEAIGIFTPTATEFPQMHRRAVEGRTPAGEPFYFRIFPENGAWDRLGGYTGVIPVLLSVAGLMLSFSKNHRKWRSRAIFFLSAAIIIILKNMGLPPFAWIAHLPLFDLVWSQRWAGPVWVFSLAAGAAMALEMIAAEASKGRYASGTSVLKLLAALSAMVILYLSIDFFNFIMWKKAWSSGLDTAIEAIRALFLEEYIGPSFMLGSILSVAFLFLSALFAVFCLISKRGLLSLPALALLELWWAAPRGYESAWLFMKLIPLIIGFLAAVLLAFERKKAALALTAVFFVSFMALDQKAEKGLPERRDPFASAPYVDFLKGRNERVTAGEGVLFPNFSSALSIQDIRFISSLSVDSFHNYKNRFLQNEPNRYFSLWFTGRMTRVARGGGIVDAGMEESLEENLKHYSFLGVKYLVLPRGLNADMPVAYRDSSVTIYENANALPRAFVAYGVELANGWEAAQEAAARAGFDALKTVVLERPLPLETGTPGAWKAEIASYRANSVKIKAETSEDGILVLTDVFYPGWKAFVDGEEEEVQRVNGLVRGVALRKGAHTVEFRYSPLSFAVGCAFFLGGALAAIVLVFSDNRTCA